MAIATQLRPIEMHRMEDPDQVIPVATFFVLGLKTSAGHIKLLQTMMQLIQEREFVEQIHEATTIDAVMTAIHDAEQKVNL